ncbi:MAG: UDP-2,3-diacylglucosamine diphosphatase, partial [Pseudomonadota bacterium]
GIVCGHIHKPAIMTIDGVGYFNDGDWVEHGTALMERNDGMLELTKWNAGSAPRPISAAA